MLDKFTMFLKSTTSNRSLINNYYMNNYVSNTFVQLRSNTENTLAPCSFQRNYGNVAF